MRTLLLPLLIALTLFGCSGPDSSFTADFTDSPDRVWIGPEYYANRMLDWELRDGRLQAVEGRQAKPMRTVHLLTRWLADEEGSLVMSVRTGSVGEPDQTSDLTWVGFLVGAGGSETDYRISSLVHHWPAPGGGLFVGVDGTGRIVVRDNENPDARRAPRADFTPEDWPLIEPSSGEGTLESIRTFGLRVMAAPGEEGYDLVIETFIPATDEVISHAVYPGLDAKYFTGNVALVSHGSASSDEQGYWFDDWTVEGSKVRADDSRAFGPVLGVQYTLSEGTLKMTAQMGPLGPDDSNVAELQIADGATWTTVARGELDTNGYTIGFRVEDWAREGDTPFRVLYSLWEGAEPVTHHYEGTIHATVEGEEFVLAAMNCHHISGGDGSWTHNHFWWPHQEVADKVAYHEPDMIFFAGDQIYESGLAGIVRSPEDTAILDYLYHWNRFLWAFGDLTRHRPTVTIPDDHDVYHGNIWGAGGKAATGPHSPASDNGGYIQSPGFVNAVHRTQTSHLPDPYDPTPVQQDISVYYTNVEFGGVSFAVLGDRQFKSAPRDLMPEAQIWNGWPRNPDWDAAKDGDHPDAVLLGDRQLAFMDHWARDWGSEAWMKVLLSQTLFANVATIPVDHFDGSGIPGLPIPPPGEIVTGYKKAMDHDSNGWPQTGRNKVVDVLRRARAFHVAGDQHLGSTVRYGKDTFQDAGYGFVVPSIANIWPRRWFPPEVSPTRDPSKSWYTGDHLDGFGNHMTVMAVANPVNSEIEPTALYDRTPGYGIVRMNRTTRNVVLEAWPRWVDPSAPGAAPYADWPVAFHQEDGDGRRPVDHLANLTFDVSDIPVVEVTDLHTGDHIYSIRPGAGMYRIPVYETGRDYHLRVTWPDGTERSFELPAGSYPMTGMISKSAD